MKAKLMKKFKRFNSDYFGNFPFIIRHYCNSFKGLDNGLCIIWKCRDCFKMGYYCRSQGIVLIRPINERKE